MSNEEGGAEPEGAGAASEKSQAPKPATFSSFINKNTSGKKFAPKAARRRPGAATAAPAKPPIPQPSTEVAEENASQNSQPEGEPSTAPITNSVPVPQLPSPAPTQEPTIPSRTDPSPSIPEPLPESEQRPVDDRRVDPASASVVEEQEVSTTVPDPLAETETGPAGKSRRTEIGEQAAGTGVGPATQITEVVPTLSPEREAVLREEQDIPTTGDENRPTAATSNANEEAEADLGPRVTPWTAVNQAEIEEQEAPSVAAPKTRPGPKPRRRKNLPAVTEEPVGVEDDTQSPQEPKTRGKRKAVATVEGEIEEVAPPPKRTRRPRKSKATVTAEDDGEEGENAVQDVTEAERVSPRPPKKPRQPRKKKQLVQGAENGANREGVVQPKRKGRPPREPTPDDAADRTIDPENTFMDSLASRNIRVGKLSRREQEMRKIDWAAVRQRQREEDARPIETRDLREARERLAAEQMQTTETGPQYRLVDGQIQLVAATTTIDRYADADRERELMEVTEERALTTRITSRSFMKNNKRFPNEFVLPGQGKRWTADDTELFYQGLRSFGTDFQMISRMFPGSTRRSIKTKFTREEREHPDDVRESLLGKSELTQNWDTFLKASQMEEEEFADADEIKRQLAEEEAEMRERIAAAQAETAERRRQQREAGVLDDEEGKDASNKENNKGKKKRKGKEKQVAFQEDDGVEILGGIDDDDSWGKE